MSVAQSKPVHQLKDLQNQHNLTLAANNGTIMIMSVVNIIPWFLDKLTNSSFNFPHLHPRQDRDPHLIQGFKHSEPHVYRGKRSPEGYFQVIPDRQTLFNLEKHTLFEMYYTCNVLYLHILYCSILYLNVVLCIIFTVCVLCMYCVCTMYILSINSVYSL